jgi:hypothetical protein
MFWNRLKKYSILNVPAGKKEDDCLLSHCYGMIDIAKVPRPFGQEPTDDEYEKGTSLLFNILEIHKPKIIVFVYKKVLDKILYCRFKISDKSNYGFNEKYQNLFGCMPFVFPMPRTRCRREDADDYMKKLAEYISTNKKDN